MRNVHRETASSMRHLVAAVLAVALLGAAGACSRSPEPLTGNGGIEGRALIGPSCPVERAGSPCPDLPFRDVIRVLDGTRVVTTFRPGADGRFRVALPAGSYRLESANPGRLPSGPEPDHVTVRADEWTTINLAFDSGIR